MDTLKLPMTIIRSIRISFLGDISQFLNLLISKRFGDFDRFWTTWHRIKAAKKHQSLMAREPSFHIDVSFGKEKHFQLVL